MNVAERIGHQTRVPIQFVFILCRKLASFLQSRSNHITYNEIEKLLSLNVVDAKTSQYMIRYVTLCDCDAEKKSTVVET